MTPTQIYLCGVVEYLMPFLFLTGLVFGIAGCICAAMSAASDTRPDVAPSLARAGRMMIASALIMALLFVLVPSKTTLSAMYQAREAEAR